MLVSLVYIYIYICAVIDCNEWKTEKCHDCTNMEKVK